MTTPNINNNNSSSKNNLNQGNITNYNNNSFIKRNSNLKDVRLYNMKMNDKIHRSPIVEMISRKYTPLENLNLNSSGINHKSISPVKNKENYRNSYNLNYGNGNNILGSSIAHESKGNLVNLNNKSKEYMNYTNNDNLYKQKNYSIFNNYSNSFLITNELKKSSKNSNSYLPNVNYNSLNPKEKNYNVSQLSMSDRK